MYHSLTFTDQPFAVEQRPSLLTRSCQWVKTSALILWHSLECKLILWFISCAFTGLVVGLALDIEGEDKRSRKPQSSRYHRGVQRVVRMNFKRRGGA